MLLDKSLQKSVAISETRRVVAVLLAGGLIGFATDAPWMLSTIALLLLLSWHAYYAIRLLQEQPGKLKPDSFPSGIWQEIASQISQQKNRNLVRKRKLSRFFKQFRDTARSIHDGLVIIDGTGTIDWCNPAAEEFLGLKWPHDKGTPFVRHFNQPEVVRYLGLDDARTPVEFTSSNNNALILSMQLTHFGKKRHQRLVIVRDITAIRNVDHIRRDFIADISHELRTPLTVIHGYLETLQEDQQECPHWQRPLELMAQQTDRMQGVVEDLLTLSRLELKPIRSTQSATNIPRILREIVGNASELARLTQHQINVDLDTSLWLRGNDEELRSAFGNLVYNAVRHTPPATNITLRWRKRHNGLVFSVQDSGEGIEPRHIPRLTERFYRVDSARSRETGGTGLGLAIVKQIIQSYGGRLRINSTPGKGSTFSCIFPKELRVKQHDLPLP